MSRERLQKVLARAGVASRRQVEELIREGRVTLNGRVAEIGDRADLVEDAVKVDGRKVNALQRPKLYLLVNKPRAVVSTVSDPEDRSTIMELLPERMRKGLVPVGRLDYDTEGLIIVTDDGEFAHRVSHPRFGCVKTYEVKVKGFPKAGDLDRLRRGIRLEGKMTAPARIHSFTGPEGPRDSKSNSWLRVAISEGRTRQIREMFLRVGYPVQRLRRVAIGSVSDPHLPRGEWRIMTPEEIESLRSGSAKPPSLSRGRKVSHQRGPKSSEDVETRKPGTKGAGSKDAGSKDARGRSSEGKGRSSGKRTSPATGDRPSRGRAGRPSRPGTSTSKTRPSRAKPGAAGSRTSKGPRKGPRTSGRGNPR